VKKEKRFFVVLTQAHVESTTTSKALHGAHRQAQAPTVCRAHRRVPPSHKRGRVGLAARVAVSAARARVACGVARGCGCSSWVVVAVVVVGGGGVVVVVVVGGGGGGFAR
jgi:hypothetical protein